MSSTVSASGLGSALNRIISLLLFAVAPVVVTIAVLGWTFNGSTFLSDFHGDLYNAGKAILNGQDPYRAAFLAHLAAIARAGGHPNTTFAVPVYPAPALVAMVPLALLPYKVAGIIFTLLGVAALALGLRLFGVRDWRCYGAAFLSWPVLHTLRLGQVNEFLILALAIAWRSREREVISGIAIATAVVAKVFLWPIGLFLLLTRRWRALATGVAFGIAVVLIAWAIIGFAGFSTYPRMLSDLSAVEGTAGISLLSLAGAAGVAHGFATAASALITLGLIGLAWLALRIDGGERSAFGLLILAGLTSSSLVWPHYLTLLFVPIALLSPAFGPLWLVPLLAYLAPVELTHGNAWQIAVYLAIELVVTAALIRPMLPARREAVPAADSPDRSEGERPTGRLAHGLRSTSFRSYIAAQRPTKGSSGPLLDSVGDRTAQTVNRRPV